MVEKFFETPAVNTESHIYIEVSSDKDAFLDQVYKRKEEKDDDILSAADTVARYIQLPDSQRQAHGGGYLLTEDKVEKPHQTSKQLFAAAEMFAASGEHLRRISILAAVHASSAELSGEPSSKKKHVDKQDTENSSVGMSKTKADVLNTRVPLMQSISSSQALLSAKSGVDQKKSALESIATNVAITNAPLSFAEFQAQTQRSEITKGQENQRPLASAMLQKTMQSASAPAGNKHDGANRSLDIDYPFQRWAGDHSVKISIPTEARREVNITLLPSDTRAAEVLSRQMAHLSGHTAELLQPEQDSEERERRQQQDIQDEEQE